MDINKELEELFADPLLDVTDQEAKLFDIPADMKRVMDAKRIQPDHYAQRKKCEEFEQYRPLFKTIQKELNEGTRSLIRISKTVNLEEGRYFVVSGQMVFLAHVGKESKASNGMKNARTHCIFEDGTESDILLQTLRKNIVADGYGISEPQEKTESEFTALAEGDRSTGYIYVLRSLSPDPEIAGVKDLYKIGFTINSVEERVANAVHEPTYLNAPVQIMLTAQIVNMNSHKFETLVHQVFHAVNFKIKVYDENGEEHEPSEWYVAPLEIIELVIQKIADRSILNYTYNAEMRCLEKRVVKKGSTFNVSGLRVLTLNIKNEYFQDIIAGRKDVEYREIKQTTINKYTYRDEADGKRYLRPYDVVRFYVGYHKDRDSALVEITKIENPGSNKIDIHLGRILEYVKG